MKQNSKINVNKGGRLTSIGFIYGDGIIEAQSGSIIEDNFFNQSFRGGTVTFANI